MTHTPPSKLPPNLEWSAALALCQQYNVGKGTLRKWREANPENLCHTVPGRRRRRLYRSSVLLRLCGATD